MTAHGTPLTGTGSPDVLVGGQPAWRAADFHACPLASGPVPHVGGPVVTGSASVLINGSPAARLGDVIVENGPPNTITAGEPTVLVGGAGWTSAEPSWASSLYEQLSSFVEDYNGDVAEADLGPPGGQLSDETVDLFVTTGDGEAAFSFRTDGDNRIEEFQRGSREDATVRMETDRETVDRITGSGNPVGEFRRAVSDGDIAVSGIGPVNAIRWRILNGINGLLTAAGTV